MGKRKMWSDDEVKYLVELYIINGLSVSELYHIFNEKYSRTLESIKVKIGKLKLKHTKDQTSQIKSRLFSGERNGMFGKESPMKGLTLKNSQLMRDKSTKLSLSRKEMFRGGRLIGMSGETNPMYGVKAWNNGLTKYDDDRILKYGEKISKIKKEAWLLKSDDEKNEVIIRLNLARAQTNKSTRIENKIEGLLIDNNIIYIKNKRLGLFLLDFYLREV